jgi:hypothetical protein
LLSGLAVSGINAVSKERRRAQPPLASGTTCIWAARRKRAGSQRVIAVPEYVDNRHLDFFGARFDHAAWSVSLLPSAIALPRRGENHVAAKTAPAKSFAMLQTN